MFLSGVYKAYTNIPKSGCVLQLHETLLHSFTSFSWLHKHNHRKYALIYVFDHNMTTKQYSINDSTNRITASLIGYWSFHNLPSYCVSCGRNGFIHTVSRFGSRFCSNLNRMINLTTLRFLADFLQRFVLYLSRFIRPCGCKWPKVIRVKIERNNLWRWSCWHWWDVLQSVKVFPKVALLVYRVPLTVFRCGVPRHCHTERTQDVHRKLRGPRQCLIKINNVQSIMDWSRLLTKTRS